MCGIFGCIGKMDIEDAHICINKIAHRGPDALVVKPLEGAVLAHARLAILDTSDNANQPMADQSGRYWIVYNGEVYNYLELRKELEQLGYHFNTMSDTEVVLYSYIEWGMDFQKKCNGMWGVAIWDDVRKELFLSRDRFGVKPLYYFEQDNNFYFASEMKAFFPIMREKRINYNLVEKKQYFSYEATPDCCIKQIKKVMAGHCGFLKNGHLNLQRWWSTLDNLIQVPKNYEEQVKLLRNLFLDACRIRMRSDVPIGTALSGGLDSSAVVGAINYIFRTEEKDIDRNSHNLFVASMPGSSIDETKYAELAADYVGLDIQKVMVNAKISADKLLEYMYLCEDPYFTSPIPFMQTYGSMAERGVKVSIDGHGADELFGGYELDICYAVLEDRNNEELSKDVWKIYNNISMPEYKLSYKEFMHTVDEFTKRESINEDLKQRVHGNFNGFLYKQTHNIVLPTLLRCYDRYSMGNGVEIRMPFMDHRIVCFAFSIPWQSKLNAGYTKRIVRDMASPFMSREVIYRKTKIGFNSPITEWLQGDMKEFILDMIHSQEFYECELINSLDVSIEINEFYKQKRYDYSEGDAIWNMLVLFLWKKAMGL